MHQTATAPSQRWAARPVLGGLVRVLVLVVPVLVGVLAAVGLTRVLPVAASAPDRVLWWVAVLGGSVLAGFGADRLARRALPLAVLLELSLVFPDRAPSRLRAARTASVRELEQRLSRLRAQGGEVVAPYEAAETLVTLVGILGLHDKRTRGHSERVRAFTDLLTEELGLDEDARVRLRWAALVHDLGKLQIPTSILNGGTDLGEDDWEQIRRHPEEGVRLVAGLLPWLGEWGGAIGEHHERFDGGGYPAGLSGEGISYAGRIVAVADSFEVMTSARSYNAPRSAAAARAELARCAGGQFDPAIVRAFLGISIGRLVWVLGPVTWLAQLPFVAAADRAGQAVKAGAVTALAGVLVFSGALPGPGGADAGGWPPVAAPGEAGRGSATDDPDAGHSRVGAVRELAPGALLAGPDPAGLLDGDGVAPLVGSEAPATRSTPAAPGSPEAGVAPGSDGGAPRGGAGSGRPDAGAGDTDPGATAPGAPRPDPAPRETTADRRSSPPPAAARRPYYLAPSALRSRAPSADATASSSALPGDGPAVAFVLPVSAATTLSEAPLARLFVQLLRDQPAATLTGTLAVGLHDCAQGGRDCRTLSSAERLVQVSRDEVAAVDVALPPVAATVAGGRELRLTVGLVRVGNARDGRLVFGAPAVPSHLELTTARAG